MPLSYRGLVTVSRTDLENHVFIHLLEYHNRITQTGWLKQQEAVFPGSGDWKSYVKTHRFDLC